MLRSSGLATVALGLATFACGLVTAQEQERIPVAVGLGLVGHGGSSTTRPPTVAVSETGTIYVLWNRPYEANTPVPEGVARLPKELTPAKKEGWGPALAVCRNGRWSKPGLLTENESDCAPLFAWCEGEKLHLLLMSAKEEECQHLRYDPDAGRWNQLGKLPFGPSQYEPIQQVGKQIHIACAEEGYVHYFFFDGSAWSKPVRIEESKNPTNLVTRARLAIGHDGAAHVAWWTATLKPNDAIHGYAVVKGDKVEPHSIRFEPAPILRDAFDLGVDHAGRVVIAYQANLPAGHADENKIHVRKFSDKSWTEPEKLAGGWERLFGEIRIVSGKGKMLLSWLAREETKLGGGFLVHLVRRLSLSDGKAWSTPRPLAVGESDAPIPKKDGIPVGPIGLKTCVDHQGNVHVVWGSPEAYYCVAASLVQKKPELMEK